MIFTWIKIAARVAVIAGVGWCLWQYSDADLNAITSTHERFDVIEKAFRMAGSAVSSFVLGVDK